ncbi:type III-B CRISPR module-associated protein Cmr3 [Hyalangium versicolor]|uniref:type III-B CRISPR module-associated protein Cmr3 n=1 Tax=Hyalangium versicolor TaxID=2861190 RepID=UPI001CC9E7E1|nr:type III-B CRISPR module-associated protein Cmr3 [Hyalangium versicolor]
MSHARFALLPRDGLFCKDGRGWYTSDVGRSHAHVWPPPSTLRGALRAAWGHSLMARTQEVLTPEAWERETRGVTLGPLLALRRPWGHRFTPEHRLWPVPADALSVGGQLRRLLPRPTDVATLGPDDDDALEALWYPPLPPGKPDPLPPFWTDECMRCWLRGEIPAPQSVPELVRRNDVRVTLDPATQAAMPGMLYQAEVLETLDRSGEWALGVECALPEEAPGFPRGLVGLGGKRRLAVAEPVDAELFTAPGDLPKRAPGLRLVLATPAEFQRGWLPDGLKRGEHEGRPAWVGLLPGVEDPVVLRAALVPRPLELSTWDMARRKPRATRRLVPAGATYFFEKADGHDFTALQTLWLAAWGGGREEGLGRVLPGHWNPEEGRT